jgi:hypothetical protein
MFIKGTCQLGLDPLSFLFSSDEVAERDFLSTSKFNSSKVLIQT